MGLHSETVMIEVGVRILGLELLNGPPCRSCICDISAPARSQPGVKYTDHRALAVEDKRPRVALRREGTGLPVIVADCKLSGLNTEFVTDVCLESRAASNREVGGTAVLHDDHASLAVGVECVGNGKELTRDAAADPELAIRGELECSPAVDVMIELKVDLQPIDTSEPVQAHEQ